MHDKYHQNLFFDFFMPIIDLSIFELPCRVVCLTFA
jgi:hypothetical protein